MNETRAAEIITKSGYLVENITYLPEGRSHDVFFVTLKDGEELVAKFEKETRKDSDGIRRDFHYNGVVSLEREQYIFTLVRERSGLPTPKVKKLCTSEDSRFLLMERMPGKLWAVHLQERDYSHAAYLQSLSFLGADIAQVQRVHFSGYGNLMDKEEIDPLHSSFSGRLEEIVQLHLQREQHKKVLTEKEREEVYHYFSKNVKELTQHSSLDRYPPTLILADLHPMNFLVDEQAKPSGYIDLEFSQSGHPAMEFYNIGLQFFNYFDQRMFQQARRAFYDSFTAAGGKYHPNFEIEKKLDNLLCLGHILQAVTAYHGIRDGLRDRWSEQFKELLFSCMHKKEMDYVGFADIIREKTKQPRNPTLP